MSIWDFFTPEAGQQRRQWLEGQADGLLTYVPPELRPWLMIANEVNPITSMERAGEASNRMVAPGMSGWDRMAAAGDMLSNVAGVVAPAVAAKAGAVPVANAVEEALTGYAPMVQPFMWDEYGGVGFGDEVAARGAQIMDMLRSGRGADVTDDMLDMGDPVLNARLNEWLFNNYDLPMDAASRAARAGEIGMDTAAYHATRSDVPFSSFRPGARGSIYMAATPQGAEAGASGQILEDYGAGAVRAVLPLNVNSQDVAGLSVNRAAFDALPEKITDEATIKEIASRVRQSGLQYWDDAYEAVPFRDEYRYYKREAPVVSYQDVEPGKDAFGYRLGGFNSGSDVAALERVRDQGRRGFLVADEGGSSIVASPDMPIRSRFARFDPRLAHLRNLSASLAAVGLLGFPPQDDN